MLHPSFGDSQAFCKDINHKIPPQVLLSLQPLHRAGRVRLEVGELRARCTQVHKYTHGLCTYGQIDRMR